MEILKENSLSLYISGVHFVVNKDIILKKPDSYLGRLAVEGCTQYSFDRPVASFEAVLAFYQTGELHMPLNVCPKAFRTELEFWGIPHMELNECCLYKYLQFMDDFNLKTSFMQEKAEIGTASGQKDRLRARLWRVIDNREVSLPAKVYFLTGISFVLTSTVMIAIFTLPENRRFLTPCEIQVYYREEFDGYLREETNLLSVDCDAIHMYMEHEYFTIGSDNVTYSLPSSMPKMTFKDDKFIAVEYTTIGFFTIELLLRLASCPDWRDYFSSIINITDIVSLIASYVTLVLLKYTQTFRLVPLKDFLDHVQVLRLLRLVRYCQHFSTVQVLVFSFRKNFRDLLVLLLYLVICILIFANIMYLAEGKENQQLKSIPQAWWLGIVTVTTVGFGDVTPTTAVGKVVCALCALSGVMLLSILLPIFVDSFITLYGIAELRVKRKPQTKGETCSSESTAGDKGVPIAWQT